MALAAYILNAALGKTYCENLNGKCHPPLRYEKATKDAILQIERSLAAATLHASANHMPSQYYITTARRRRNELQVARRVLEKLFNFAQ